MDKQLIALDAKMNFDDNALFRHLEIVGLRDLDEEIEPKSRLLSMSYRIFHLMEILVA